MNTNKGKKPSAGLLLAFAVLLASLGAVDAKGATRTWDGSYNVYWNIAANWAEGVTPTTGDDLVFPPGAANKVNYNNLSRTFRSITILDTGYILRGTGSGLTIGLTHGIESNTGGASNTIKLNINLQASQTFECNISTGSLTLEGNINVGGYTLSTSGAGQVHLSGVISGTGGLTKHGSGTHWLEGTVDNEYSGPTVVNTGTLMLGKTSGDAIKYGSLYIGNNVGSANEVIVREAAGYQIGYIPITIHKDGWLDVDDYYDTVGAITFNGGHAGSSASGTLALAGNVTVNYADTSAIFDGNLYIGSGTRTFDVANGSTYDLLMYAVISGGNVVKNGDGLMQMVSANTYTGTTTVNDGNLYVYHDEGLGDTTGGTTVTGTGYIWLYNTDVVAEPLTLERPHTSGYSVAVSGNSSWAGDVTLNDDVAIYPGSSSSTMEFTGSIGGTGGIHKTGSGNLTFSGSAANTYSGDTHVDLGALYLNKTSWDGAVAGAGDLYVGNGSGAPDSVLVQWLRSNQVDEDVTINVLPGGTVDLNGYDDLVGDVALDSADITTGAGTMTLHGNVTATKHLGVGENTRIYGNLGLGSAIRTFNVTNSPSVSAAFSIHAHVSGTGGIRKTGGGKIYLHGANTYEGVTTVAQGHFGAMNDLALGTTGGGTVVEDGASLQLYNADVVGESLSLAGMGGGFDTLYSHLTDTSWSGAITLQSDVAIGVYSTNATLTLSGAIGGAGGFTKKDVGSLQLSGAGNNTFSGDATVEEGTLLLNKAGQSIPHSLIIGGNSPGDPSAVARHIGSAEIYDDVTVNSSGLYDLDGYNETIRNLYLNGGGDVYTDAGTLTLTENINADPMGVEGDASYMYGKLALLGDCTITTGQDDPGGGNTREIMLYAVVSGSGEITKEGEGEVALIGANTFSGPVTVNNGSLHVWNDSALGTTANGTTVNGDSVLLLLGPTRNIVGEPLVLNATSAPYNGTLNFSSGNHTWSGNVVLQQDGHFGTSTASGSLDLSGAISGSGGLVKVYNGTLTLSGSNANTYSGATVVNGGMLELNKSAFDDAVPGALIVGDGSGGAGADVVRLMQNGQIANEADVAIASSGLLDLDGNYDRVDALTGSGLIELDSGHLLAGHSGSSFTYNGTVSGSGYLWKVGTGTWTLTANNNYSGTTRIQEGTLLINGSQPASDVDVWASATLGGIGTVGAITSSGTVAPGNSAGQLGSGSASLNSGSFDVELNGNTLVDYDQLDVGGSVSLVNANLNINWGYVPTVGDVFMIIENDGGDSVSGTFNGYAEGASIVVGDVTLEISYQGGTGNDVVLEATDVPVDDLIITSITAVGGNIELEWIGGTPSYQIEKKESLTNEYWIVVYGPTSAMSGIVPADTTNGFYRVTGGH